MNFIDKRASGILLHISSLPSEYGIGDIGKPAYAFIDFLKKSGQKFWQILPLNPTSPSKGNSPYASFSAFAGNPLFISPEILFEENLISKSDLNSLKLLKPSRIENKIDYKIVTAIKNMVLDKACKNFFKNYKKYSAKYSDDFDDFCNLNEEKWLEDFAVFVVLKNYFKKKYNIKSWKDWPEIITNRDNEILFMLKNKLDKAIKREKFIQYIFYRQWASLKNYADKQGIKIIGDIPVYVDYESADVWSNQKLFKLGNDKNAAFIAGVPPDYFSKTGQLWNNPVYNWKTLKSENFSWWIERLKHNLTIFDVVRIDHFRGFIAYWEVPYGEKTAEKGRWVNSYGEELFYQLLKDIKNPSIIAENLGVITPDVEEVIKKFNFYGIKVLQFAFGKDFPSSDHLPSNYSKNL
ncbi:MAG: 4-alpha-glucanotransferase, partial [Actinobacteria bacterium]|nr:4-alpha-glucanotransferase [Actinomycetota bacterium]